jgi:hypothetical protein
MENIHQNPHSPEVINRSKSAIEIPGIPLRPYQWSPSWIVPSRGGRGKLPAPGGSEGARSQTMLHKILPFSALSLFVTLQVNPFRQGPITLQLQVSLPILCNFSQPALTGRPEPPLGGPSRGHTFLRKISLQLTATKCFFGTSTVSQ